MAETTAFELVSPEKLLISREVGMVIVPGAEGNLGVLPRHAPMISTVRAGVIEVFESRGAEAERIFVAGGFAEITPERCTVLAEEAVGVADIDRAAVEQQIKDLTEDVADAKESHAREQAEAKLAVAKAKLDAVG
jgi:F-type H+-transporting ATPase subunit epsilon